MRLVVGIDWGGTNTRAALAAETGEVLGIGLAGPSNYDDVGVAIAQRNIKGGGAASMATGGTKSAIQPTPPFWAWQVSSRTTIVPPSVK